MPPKRIGILTSGGADPRIGSWWICNSPKVVNLNGVGLIESFRGVGANTLLYTELARSIHASGYEHAEVVQVEEKNSASLRDMAAIGVTWHKRHRIYGRIV